jgi:hypothetical protein
MAARATGPARIEPPSGAEPAGAERVGNAGGRPKVVLEKEILARSNWQREH